jgi:hypothetical protein
VDFFKLWWYISIITYLRDFRLHKNHKTILYIVHVRFHVLAFLSFGEKKSKSYEFILQ